MANIMIKYIDSASIQVKHSVLCGMHFEIVMEIDFQEWLDKVWRKSYYTYATMLAQQKYNTPREQVMLLGSINSSIRMFPERDLL